jgi:hypothetical protein
MVAVLLFVLRNNYVHHNSIVSIRNTRWPRVHIQVREEYSSHPLSNKLIFDQYLVLGQLRSFSVDKGANITYRRDFDPNHADGLHFTDWLRANWQDSYTCTVNNP